MAIFKNELHLDAKQHNKEMNNAANSVKEYDKKIREAERGTRQLLASQKKQIQETQKLRKEMQQLGNSMTNAFSSKIGVNIGALTSKLTLATAAAAAFGSAIKYNIQTAAEFEEAMSKLSSLTGAVGKDLEFYKKAAIELGSTTTQSAKQVAESFAIIGSKTPELLKNKEALKEVTKAAITLGEAAGMTVDEAATALTGVINQFGLKATEANTIINMLAAASKEGAGDIKYLNDGIVKCGAVAASMGISVNKVIAILEQFAQGGLDASSAGNNLKNIFLALETSADKNLKPSVVGITQALENLKKMGLSATDMVKLFGKENIAAATILLNTTDKIKDMDKAIQGTNTAEEQARINTDNLNGSLKNLSSAWEGLNLTINDSSGSLKVFIDWCANAVNELTTLIQRMNDYNTIKRNLQNGTTDYVVIHTPNGDLDVGAILNDRKQRYKGSSQGRGRQEAYNQFIKEFDDSINKYNKALQDPRLKQKGYEQSKVQIQSALNQLKKAKQDFIEYVNNIDVVDNPPKQVTPTPKATTGGGHTPKVHTTTTTKNEPKFETGSLAYYEDQLSKLIKRRSTEALTNDEINSIDKQIAEIEVKIRDKKVELLIEPELDLSKLSNDDLVKLSQQYRKANDERYKKVEERFDYNIIKKHAEDYKLPNLVGVYSKDKKVLEEHIENLKKAQETYKELGPVVAEYGQRIAEAQKKLTELTSKHNEEVRRENLENLMKTAAAAVDSIYDIGDALSSISGVLDDTSKKALNVITKIVNTLGDVASRVERLLPILEKIYNGEGSIGDSASVQSGLFGIAMTVLKGVFSSIGRNTNGGLIPRYATGGIFNSPYTVGDHNLARVNGGEMILNGSQQAHLWNMIKANNSYNNANFNSGNVEFKIKGKELVGVLNNYNKQQSKI